MQQTTQTVLRVSQSETDNYTNDKYTDIPNKCVEIKLNAINCLIK